MGRFRTNRERGNLAASVGLAPKRIPTKPKRRLRHLTSFLCCPGSQRERPRAGISGITIQHRIFLGVCFTRFLTWSPDEKVRFRDQPFQPPGNAEFKEKLPTIVVE